MNEDNIILGPSGAYLLSLSGVLGFFCLAIAAFRTKSKDILITFIVFFAGTLMAVLSGISGFLIVPFVAFITILALGIRRSLKQRDWFLRLGIYLASFAVALFLVRAVAATFFNIAP